MTDGGEYPRVLIVSVNPLSETSNNGKTIASFFKGWPRERLAQLYFHREVPTSPVCENYFRICDEDLLSALKRLRRPQGQRVHRGSDSPRLIPQTANDRLKRSRAVRLARAVLWAGALRLDAGPVREWLDEFDPELIFFVGGDATYLYPPVERLAVRYGAALTYYITDDYVLPAPVLNPFELITRLWTRRAFRRTCARSRLVLTIGEAMSQTYRERFGVESRAVMNMVALPPAHGDAHRSDVASPSGDLTLAYLGGLHSRRWAVLAELGRSVERARDRGNAVALEIYTAETPTPQIREALDRPPAVRFGGALDANGVAERLSSADVLVHVEASDRASKRVTLLSVSTKISEYLAAGRPILAIGPAEVASIAYLTQTGAAFVASDTPDDMDRCLDELLGSAADRSARAARARVVAATNHDETVVRPRLHGWLRDAARDRVAP